MSDKLIPFNFESKEIRVVKNELGEPWFVAKDVCQILEYANPRQAIDVNLDTDEKGVYAVDTLGGKQDVNIISESGLYTLILRSNKPKAKEFRKWVTSEVLPSIRKTGKYEASNVVDIAPEPITALAPIANPVQYLKENAAQVQSNVRTFKAIGKDLGLTGNQLTLSVVRIIKKAHNGLDLLQVFEQQAQLVEAMQQRHFTATELGERFGGLSAVKFNKVLEEQGFQFSIRDRKNNVIWVATEKGKPYCDLTVVTRANSDGTSHQLRWYETVLDVLASTPRQAGATNG